ncbi:MAG: CHASE2 domain-containing protein [Microcoleaceae cyanobacterium]
MLKLYVQKVEQSCLFELAWEAENRLSAQILFPKTVISLYQEWQKAYLKFYQAQATSNVEKKDNNFRGKSAGSGTISPNITDWKGRLTEAEARLLYDFNQWLRHSQLFDIRAKIAEISRNNSTNQSANLYLVCSSIELAKLPWESWEIGAEFANTNSLFISRIPNQITARPAPKIKRSRSRILAIIGQDGNTNFKGDLKALKSQLQPLAEIKAVGWELEKSISELETEIKQALTDEKGWDVLFFAGHSNETSMTGGELGIAPEESLHIQNISHQLEIAKNNGLQFALFNSCNGLNIAETLINLGISQVAVMREPIPNPVAQEFLLQFLQHLAEYKTVQESLITACNTLEIEKSFTYPSAYLIPSLFCYPNTQWFQLQPSGWRTFIKQFIRPKWYEVVALATLSILSWQIPVQYQLLEQRVKNQAIYRNLTQQLPQTKPDILLVEIDEPSLAAAGLPDPTIMSRSYLAKLVNQATQFNRKIIGLDYVLNAPQPEEDAIFKIALNQAKALETLFILATSRSTKPGYRLWPNEQFITSQTWQGDTIIWRKGRFMTLIPFLTEERPLLTEERPLPLSYLLALAKVYLDSGGNLLQPKNPTELTQTLFNQWIQPSEITQIGYSFRQYWLHPITDFSIPPQLVYKTISAKDFLATQPSQLQQKYSQSVVFIIPGGYRTAGVNKFGEDNLSAPPAFCYWQKTSQSQLDCPLFVGGKVHAYLFHHFLDNHFVIPISDLWLLWLFVPIAKSISIFIKNYDISPKNIILILIGSTLIYGLISLQLYISALILLPITIPVVLIWFYVTPNLIESNSFKN